MNATETITLPYKYVPRDYQVVTFDAFDSGYRRIMELWHRRAGKTKTYLSLIGREMAKEPATYYHFFPTGEQGRKIVWDGIDKRNGMRFIEHLPQQLIASKNNSEMKITYKNGAIYQILGTDRFNSIVGPNPFGCVFDEFSLQNPAAWELIRPILLENGGWAAFVYTPRGRNHAYDLHQLVKDNPDWFIRRLGYRDTGVFTDADIERERAEGMSEERIQSEYFCSFEGSVIGSYYGAQMSKAREEGRIKLVPHEPALKVHTAWDLGMDDAMVQWYFQLHAKEVRIIDYYENQGEGLSHYAGIMQAKALEHGYSYGEHYAPHDVMVREMGTGESRLATARSLGIDFNVLPKDSIEDGIDAVRRTLGRCWFDEKKAKQGIACLENYRKEYDEKNKVYRKKPLHDWASHGSDGFRYLSVAVRSLEIMEEAESFTGGDTQYATKEPI